MFTMPLILMLVVALIPMVAGWAIDTMAVPKIVDFGRPGPRPAGCTRAGRHRSLVRFDGSGPDLNARRRPRRIARRA